MPLTDVIQSQEPLARSHMRRLQGEEAQEFRGLTPLLGMDLQHPFVLTCSSGFGNFLRLKRAVITFLDGSARLPIGDTALWF